MSRKAVAALALATAVGLETGRLWAGEEGPVRSVVKYVGYKQGTAWSRPCLLLVVAPRQGGGAGDLVVPNKDPEARKFDPDPAVVEVIKKLKPGDLVQITTSKLRGHNVLNSIEPYTPKPGEDDPNAFTFVKTVEGKVSGQDRLGVVLEKGGKSQTVWLPTQTTRDGKVTVDEESAAIVRGLKEGDLVEVRLQTTAPNPVLKSIGPYQPPEKGEFVKSTEQKVGDLTYLAAEIKKGQEVITLLVPARKNDSGAMVRDPELTAKVKALRAGQVVEFKSRQSAGQVFLVDIRATGERLTSRPAADIPKAV